MELQDLVKWAGKWELGVTGSGFRHTHPLHPNPAFHCRYEEEVVCRANAENDFVALKKVRGGTRYKPTSTPLAVSSRPPGKPPRHLKHLLTQQW